MQARMHALPELVKLPKAPSIQLDEPSQLVGILQGLIGTLAWGAGAATRHS